MHVTPLRIEAVKCLSAIIFCLLLTACGAPAWKQPIPVDQVDFKTHANTIKDGDLTVTVAVPNRENTEQIFGTSLYADNVQPVWIEVDNQSDSPYILIVAGVDRHGYSPLEASYQRHSGTKETKLEMDKFFHSMRFKNPVGGGQVASGFIFTNLDEGAKAVNIDLLGNNELKSLSFVIKVDGLLTDSSRVDFEGLYPEFIEIEDEDSLREVLSSFPCCTRNKKGNKNGDPLNVVFIGNYVDVFSALIRSGWHQTEVTYGASAWKTTKSFLFGTSYRYSPISPLYVFGRQQDVGLQKARKSIHLRNHMRVWLTEYKYQDQHIFLGQISRDIGVKLNKRTITTHAIDPDIDDTRNSLIGDLAYSQSMSKFGFIEGSQVSTMEDTYYNLTPDPYYSDGNRVVMFFSPRRTTLDKIKILDWKGSYLHEILKVD